MKRAGKVTAFFVIFFSLIYFLFTKPTDHNPYFESAYFKESLSGIDSLKSRHTLIHDSLYAGFATVSITPLLNQPEDNYSEGEFKQLPLAGYGGRKGEPATGVHDSIFIKAAALKTGNQTLFFVSADLLIMPPNIVEYAMEVLSANEISRSQLFFSATHTHSSLGAWGYGFIARQFAGKENENLQKWLGLKTAEAILKAAGDLKRAEIATGNFDAGQFTRNRLIGKLGTKNDDFSYIFLKQKEGKAGIIGSFSAHPTILGSENMEISAEYPGYWARKMKDSVDFAMFLAGSMGSQSPAGEATGFEKAKNIGESLADSLLVKLNGTETEKTTSFALVSLEIPLPKFQIRLTARRNLPGFISNKLMPYTGSGYLQAVRFGNMVWISTPADFSGEYAVQIKNELKVKGFDANITSFNGKYLGYIIPGRYFYLDKYEARVMGWFGPNMGDYSFDLIRRLSEIVTTN